MNKLDYTCSIADTERELNMLFEFWDNNFDYRCISELSVVYVDDIKARYQSLDSSYFNCRPSTRIQEFISVDVLPSGFVWEALYSRANFPDYVTFDFMRFATKSDLEKSTATLHSIKCIGLASNYAHYADELNMKVIEGVRCDYEE